MSDNLGRINHGENPEQDKFDCYVDHIIKNLKLVPHKAGRKKLFEAMTRKRDDQEQLKQAIRERWNQ